MNRKFALSLLALALSGSALAGVKVSSLNLTTSGDTGYISIGLDGRSNELPDLRVYGNVIELSLSQAEAFSGLSKTVKGAFLSANVLNGKAIIKTILPYAVSADSVNVGWKNSAIEVSFPRGSAAKSSEPANAGRVSYEGSGVSPKEVKPAAPSVPSHPPKTAYEGSGTSPKEIKPDAPKGDGVGNKISKDILNEDYLNKLMKEETTAKGELAQNEERNDQVSTKLAAPGNTNSAPIRVIGTDAKAKSAMSDDKFSMAGYAVKFTLFLAVVLGLFWGIVQLLKKGVFSRGKLGFLNNSQMIQVLSTTYVAPKRSLMVVKAHKQIFLVANSEAGLTFLSEMTDSSGLIKEGEKFVTGTNFDENFNQVEAQKGYDAFIKVKEDIMQSTPVTTEEPKGLAKLASAKNDIVKFSDELKKKAKKLKPIEFN